MTPSSPEEPWRPSDRALRYWSAIILVVFGIVCGAVIPGTTGGTICTAIVGVGLVAIISMIFYDVGLTEDRDRERQRRRLERLERLSKEPPRRSSSPAPHDGVSHGPGRARGSSLGRMRSERRHLP